MNISQRLRACAKHTGLDAVIELLQEAADEIDALQARAQVQGEPGDVMRDAQRYRWLRDNGVLGFSGAPSWRVSVSFDAMDAYAQTLDSNIDAAMLAAK